MSKSCCSCNKVTCFKLLSLVSIESLQHDFYALSETAPTQKLKGLVENGDKSILILFGFYVAKKSWAPALYARKSRRQRVSFFQFYRRDSICR